MDLGGLFDTINQALASWFRFLLDRAGALYERFGYGAVLLGALAENTFLLGLVVPGGTVVLLGAFYAAQGRLALPLVFLLAWLGTFLGATLDYLFGRYLLGRVRLPSRWQARLDEGLDQTRGWLQRRGAYALLLAHFIGHIRSFVAVSAGVSHLPYWRFALYELLASGLWTFLFCLAGYWLADNLQLVERIFNRAGLILGAVIVLLAVVRWWAKRRGRELSRPLLVALVVVAVLVGGVGLWLAVAS